MKKNLIPLLLCVCAFLSTACPTNTYAAEDEQVENLLTQAGQIEQLEDGAVSEDGNSKRDRMVELLRENMDGLEDDPTVSGGYKIIDKILSDSQVDLAGTGSVVKATWKKYYKQEAMALGVKFDSVYSIESDTGATVKNEDAAKNDAEDAAVKVNILTWKNTTDSMGHSLNKANQGTISKLLTAVSITMQSFMDNIRAFAVALAITFGVIGIMTMVSDRSASNEMLTREFIKLFIGVWFIYNYKFFALLIIRAGSMVIETVMTGVSNSSSVAAKYAMAKSLCTLLQSQNLTTMGTDYLMGIGTVTGNIYSSLSGAFGDLTGLFGNGIVQIASSLVIYAVTIEIAVRYVFTPIAIADLYSEKWRSNGWMWLKKLFAASIQGAVIFLVIYVTNTFKDQLGASFSIITNTAINLTMIGMFAKTRQIANDLIGVH